MSRGKMASSGCNIIICFCQLINAELVSQGLVSNINFIVKNGLYLPSFLRKQLLHDTW